MALQGARLLSIATLVTASRSGLGFPADRRAREVCPGSSWVEIDERCEPVTFQAGIQIIVLCGAVVDSKPRTDDCLSVKTLGAQAKLTRGSKFL